MKPEIIAALDKFLDAPPNVHDKSHSDFPETIQTRLELIAWLTIKNGMNLHVRGWGIIDSAPDLPTKSVGLTQHEGLLLLQASGVIDGFCFAADGDESVIQHFYDRMDVVVQKMFLDAGLPDPFPEKAAIDLSKPIDVQFVAKAAESTAETVTKDAP